MGKLAFVSVEITFTESNRTIGIGGAPDQARDMRSRLAEKMNLPFPSDDAILRLEIGSDELETLVMPVLEEFPTLGCILSTTYRESIAKLDRA